MSVTITIEAPTADLARRELQALLGDQPAQIERAPTAEEVTTCKELVRDYVATNGVEPFETAEFEGLAEPAPEAEQPRRGRGRPRKTPVTIDGESTLVSETTTAAEPEQIDLEDVIAAKAAEIEADPATEEVADAFSEKAVEQSQPADPDKGWTHDDAKAVARQMYVRLGSLQQHELDERLHKNLQKFGVQRIKDLPSEKIEAFVRGVESEVA